MGKGRGLAQDSALTWFVLLALGGDGEGMHVQPQVPGHGVQQQHREGPVRVGVVQQSAQLPALQPVATHVSLGVQEGHRQGLCVEQGQQLTPPRGKGHSPCHHSPGPVHSLEAREGTWEALPAEGGYLHSGVSPALPSPRR